MSETDNEKQNNESPSAPLETNEGQTNEEQIDQELSPEKGDFAFSAEQILRNPPALFALCLGCGIIIDMIIGMNLLMAELQFVFGPALIAGGLALVFWAIKTLMDAEIKPSFDPSKITLLIRGPYQFTRNPVYIGMTISYVGGTIIMDALIALLLLIPLLWIIHQQFVKQEEACLEEKHGEAYLNYMKNIPRWM